MVRVFVLKDDEMATVANMASDNFEGLLNSVLII